MIKITSPETHLNLKEKIDFEKNGRNQRRMKSEKMTGKGNVIVTVLNIPARIPRITGKASLKKGNRWRISFRVTKSLFMH